MKNDIKQIKQSAEQVLKLADLDSTTLLYKIASEKIKKEGFYTCKLKGLKTIIEL